MQGGSVAGRPVSLWLEDTPTTSHPSLEGDHRCHVAVIGAGITGLTAALLLARDGFSVCVVDEGPVASATTAHTTAKVTSQHHLTYARIARTHGKEGAAVYASGMEAAKERIAALANDGIDCDFRRRAAYVYANNPAERKLLEEETQAAVEAGLPAVIDEDVPLPFETNGAMRFANQAEFHPRKYALGLAERFIEAGGRIFEHTRAVEVEESNGCVVHCATGRIQAEHVVVATLMPFLDRGGYFARAYPSRSYVVTARVKDAVPDAMLINAAPPIRSIRAVPFRGGELLMVLGEDHHNGSPKATPERYEQLIRFVSEHWDLESIEHRWSAQDYSPDDGVPYIGRLTRRSERIHVATGFKKWGMTSGTLAAMLISDAVAGRDNQWAALFSSTRVKPLAEAPRFLAENARVGMRFFGDRVLNPGRRDIRDLKRGEAAIVISKWDKVAGYRDEDGKLHAVSARCTHLGCQVAWNGAERTWDCPCHGSRFTVDGEILEGPATSPLPQRATPAEPEPSDDSGETATNS